MNILEGMLAGVGLTMQDYVQLTHDKNYAQLNNGCQLLVHDLRRVALQAAIAMGKEGDIIVIYLTPTFFLYHSHFLNM